MLWMTLSLLASQSQDLVEATAVPPPSRAKKAPVGRLVPQAHLDLMHGRKGLHSRRAARLDHETSKAKVDRTRRLSQSERLCQASTIQQQQL
mmetsp:Transcript_71041/g.169532  ORF Transcript_71041/g.169532 Transcript_71041/m.169532 type:complete len:92 (+) Transcript_71041:850-1125(+)